MIEVTAKAGSFHLIPLSKICAINLYEGRTYLKVHTDDSAFEIIESVEDLKNQIRKILDAGTNF